MDNNQSQPRHWHGSPGDRHEHLNVWVTGGPASPYIARRPSTEIFATGSMDRRDSGSSDMSTSSTNSATDSSPPTVSQRRRRSNGHGPSTLFESLTSQKRNSEDGDLAVRRQSWTEQTQKGGFFSRWWESYTRGK